MLCYFGSLFRNVITQTSNTIIAIFITTKKSKYTYNQINRVSCFDLNQYNIVETMWILTAIKCFKFYLMQAQVWRQFWFYIVWWIWPQSVWWKCATSINQSVSAWTHHWNTIRCLSNVGIKQFVSLNLANNVGGVVFICNAYCILFLSGVSSHVQYFVRFVIFVLSIHASKTKYIYFCSICVNYFSYLSLIRARCVCKPR